MTISIIGLIIALVVIGLAFWVVRTISAAFQVPAQVTAVVYVVLVVIVVIWLLQALTGGGHVGTIRIG